MSPFSKSKERGDLRFLVYLDTEKLVIRNGELVKRNHILHFAVALDAWSIVFGEQSLLIDLL